MFSHLSEFGEMDLMLGGSTLSNAASKAFTIGHDIALQLRQAPAGARYPSNVVAVAKRFVKSAYAAFIPLEIIDHVIQWARWAEDIAAGPILYHIGSGYLTAWEASRNPKSELEKNEETDLALRAFLDAIMPKSNLTQIKALG